MIKDIVYNFESLDDGNCECCTAHHGKQLFNVSGGCAVCLQPRLGARRGGFVGGRLRRMDNGCFSNCDELAFSVGRCSRIGGRDFRSRGGREGRGGLV